MTEPKCPHSKIAPRKVAQDKEFVDAWLCLQCYIEFEPKRKWIPVTPDSMPAYDIPVFVISETHPEEITTAMLIYEDGWLWAEYAGYGFLSDPDSYEVDDDYKYSHWFPMNILPSSPK